MISRGLIAQSTCPLFPSEKQPVEQAFGQYGQVTDVRDLVLESPYHRTAMG